MVHLREFGSVSGMTVHASPIIPSIHHIIGLICHELHVSLIATLLSMSCQTTLDSFKKTEPDTVKCRPDPPVDPTHPLVQTLGGAHGSLDGQATDVLPALLEEGDEVVDGQHDVGDELVLGHADVADGYTHAEHLLQLELDGRLDLGDLVGEVLSVRDGRGELSGLGETRAEETGDLLDERIGGDERIVLARKLLDELLVLVELLQVVRGHGVDAVVLGTVNVVLVTEDADGLRKSVYVPKAQSPPD